jgi:hypothetical protein
MKFFLIRYLLYFLSFALIILFIQIFSGESLRDQDYKQIHEKMPLIISSSVGKNTQNGNILGIQTFIHPTDYSDEKRFYEKMDFFIQEAKQRGFIRTGKTTLVFPEYIGSPLFLLNEKKEVLFAKDGNSALKKMILKYPLEFFLNYLKSSSEDKLFASILRLKSQQMYDVYIRTFSKLAGIYEVSIVAGSILIPASIYFDDPKAMGFVNANYVFSKNGKMIRKSIKTKPFEYEKRLSLLTEEPVKKEQIEKFLVLLSNDSLYKESYPAVELDYVFSPSCIFDFSNINWNDTSIIENSSAPLDKINVPGGDSQLENHKNWLGYSLKEKIKLSNAKVGIQIFARGDFYGATFMGYSNAVIKDGRQTKQEVMISDNQPGFINIWL